MIKSVNGGVVFHLMCERPTELGLAKEWEKTVYVPEPDVPSFIQRFNMKRRGGLLYIAEYIQHNQRRPQFAEPWVEPSALRNQPTLNAPKRHRRTQAEMAEMRAAHVQRQEPKKRIRRTYAQIEADTIRANAQRVINTTKQATKRTQRTKAQMVESQSNSVSQDRPQGRERSISKQQASDNRNFIIDHYMRHHNSNYARKNQHNLVHT